MQGVGFRLFLKGYIYTHANKHIHTYIYIYIYTFRVLRLGPKFGMEGGIEGPRVEEFRGFGILTEVFTSNGHFKLCQEHYLEGQGDLVHRLIL